MANFDPGNNPITAPAGAVQPTSFDPGDNPITAPPEARGNFAEIGTGLARGALADLPTMAGQALQFAGANNVGAAVRGFGTQMGASPSLTLQPDQHGGVTNFLAQGAEQVGGIAPAVVAGGAAALLGAPALVATGAGAVAGGALMGGSAGQSTLEAAQAKGLSPEAAQSASRLNAATTFATQVGLGMVGGKVLGVAGNALGKAVGSEAAPLANQVLDQLTGNSGWLGQGLKQGAIGAVEGMGIGAAQAGASAAINNEYGIDDQSPLAAAADAIPQMLSMSAILTPLGLASRALQVRAAAAKTATLASEKTDPAVRQKMADEYAAALPTSVDQQNFMANAKTAIDNGMPLAVDTGLFQNGAVQAPVPEAPPSGPPPEPVDQQAAINANVGVTNPSPLNADGTVLSRKDFSALPDNANLKGQDLAKAYKAYTTDPDVVARVQRAADFGAAYNEKSGQFGTDPVTGQERELTMGEVMERQAGPAAALAPEAPTPLLPYNAPPEAVNRMIADSNGLVKQEGDTYTFPDSSTSKDINDVKDFFTRQAAEQSQQPAMLQLLHNPTPPELDRMVATSDGLVSKEGDTFKFPDGSQTTDIKQVQSFFAEKAQRDAERAADPNSPKTSDDITNDVATANKTLTGDDSMKAQQRAPVQKQLDALGLDKLDTHQAQIGALSTHLDNSTVKIGQATRDRLQALLDQWKGENVQDAAQEPALDQNGELIHTPEDATAAGAGAISVLTKPAVDPGAAGDALRAEQLAALKARNDTFQSAVADIRSADQRINGEAPTQANAMPENIPASVETQAPTATNAALPENIPASVQAQSPGNDAALPNNLTASPRSHAQETADMVDASLASFNQRLRAGEQLTPLEQERMEDLQGFRKSLAEVTSGENSNAAYAQDISNIAREAATTPYKESYRHYRVGSPEDTDPGIMLDALRTGKMADTLNTIAQNGSTPEAKALAGKLASLDNGTTIKYAAPDGTGSVGEYQPATNHVNIFPGGESEQTILHEATHAAQQAQVARGLAIDVPRTQREAELKKAADTIESIRQTAIERAGADSQYGLTNAHEFLAELNTNPDFQKFLKSEQVNKQSLWQRAVGAVKSLFGFKAGQGDFLSRAMEANEAFFQKPEDAGFPLPQGSAQDNLFRKSPADATKVADDQLGKLGGLADKLGDKINISKISATAYRALAGFKTVEYLADRIRALPEMVQSGFSKGVDAFVHANMVKEVIHRAVAAPYDAYAKRLTDARASYGDNARDVEGKMGTIGPEASRGGFDYRMNYADNVKAGRDLSPANKAHIDDIHRQFTQLQRTNPEAAKLLVEGQLLNQKGLVNLTSVLARNFMSVAAGSHSRFTDDLANLAPTDPAHAAALARVQVSKAGNDMASTHGAKLNIMDKSLTSARNTKPDMFPDGATQALDARLNAAFADARNLPEGSALRGHLNELEQMYRAQSQNPYFALGRDGDYFVKASLKGVDEATQKKIQDALKGSNKVVSNLVGHDGDVFFRTDTMDQASGLHNKLIQAAGLKMVPDSNAYGKLAMSDPQFVHGTSQALRSMLADLHSTVENSGLSGAAADAMRETMTRSLMSLLPETSSRSAKMNRQGIPGYDADFSGNYARRAQGMVQDTANLYSQHAFDSAFSQMKAGNQQLNRTGSEMAKERSTDTMNEITRRYANMHSVVDNKVINTINSLGHAFYLAMSPAYLIRTTAQLFHRGLPYLGSKYGMVNSAKEIGAATKDAMLITGSSLRNGWKAEGIRGTLNAKLDFQNSNLSASEKAFLQEVHDRGYLDLGQTRQLQNMALGGTQRQQDLQRFASITAQAAETTNRLATGLAAFRLAEKGSKGVTQAGRDANVEYGVKAINNVMDNFDPTNTARQIGKHGFAGRGTPLMTAFMNYNLQTMQQIARTVHDGMFNQDQSPEGKQRASEARKEFSGLMATTMMISGAMGLPFVSVFAGLYNTYKDMTDPDSPGDIRDSAQNFLANTFGKTAGGVIAHGLPHAANFDSSTFGLENLLPGSEFLASRQLLADRTNDAAMNMLGPALNGGIGIAQAIGKIRDGYWAKGVEAALPSGLKPYFKAYELSQKGYTDGKDNPYPMDKPGGWDIGLQAAGFRTATKATQSDAQQYGAMRKERLADRSGLIEDRMFKGATSQDPAQMSAAQKQMQDYDAANPTQPMRNPSADIRRRLTALALGRAFGAGINVTPQEMPTLAHQLAFARDGAMPGE